jgi:hypothetical protein
MTSNLKDGLLHRLEPRSYLQSLVLISPSCPMMLKQPSDQVAKTTRWDLGQRGYNNIQQLTELKIWEFLLHDLEPL